MKKLTYSKCLLIFLIVTIVSVSNAQTAPSKLSKLGIVSELAYVKLTSENHLSKYLEDTTILDKDKKVLIEKYLAVKTIYDQLILGLVSDCIRKNNIKYFKKLDIEFSNYEISQLDSKNYNKKLKNFIENLIKANTEFNNFINFTPKPKVILIEQSPNSLLKGFFPKTSSLEEVTGVLTFTYSVIKDIKETKTKKKDAIVELLNTLRLSSIQELGKPKEEEKKDDNKKEK